MNTPLYAYAIAAIGFSAFGLMVLAAVLNGKDVEEESFSCDDIQKHHNCWSYWAVCPVCIKKWRRFTSKDGDFNHVHRCPNCK